MTAVGSFTMLIDSGHAFGSKPPSVGDDPGLALILPIAAGLLCGFGSQVQFPPMGFGNAVGQRVHVWPRRVRLAALLSAQRSSYRHLYGYRRRYIHDPRRHRHRHYSRTNHPSCCPVTPSASPNLPVSIHFPPLSPHSNQLGSGCTSGHGVCGLPRFSLRSAVAVATFMATGAATSMTLGAIATGTTAANRPPGEPIPATNTWLLVLAVCATAMGAIIAYRCPFCNECLDTGAAAGAAGGAAGESASLSKDAGKLACSSGGFLGGTAPLPLPRFWPLPPPLIPHSTPLTSHPPYRCNPYKVKDFLDPVHRCNPYKVKDFLDPVHGWDPSLAFVMGGAVAVNVVTFRFILARPNPLFESKFFVPSRKDITWELVVGSAIFGMGWGLAGYCPAPAFVSLSTGNRNPKASKEGVSKLDLYRSLFGDRMPAISARMASVFDELGLKYSLGGLTGNTMDSHRLIALAGTKDREKGGEPAGFSLQHRVVEELFLDYFTREKFIGDRQVLLAAAERAGLQGAAEWLDNPQSGLQEVEAELQRYRPRVSGVPHFIIGGQEFSGAQPPAVLLEALKSAASVDS
ncbi:unnamed protein product [Closterium sp. Naga37s-1]|nr:unnamed protein product [Closterium sp. Naga37s-1]